MRNRTCASHALLGGSGSNTCKCILEQGFKVIIYIYVVAKIFEGGKTGLWGRGGGGGGGDFPGFPPPLYETCGAYGHT